MTGSIQSHFSMEDKNPHLGFGQSLGSYTEKGSLYIRPENIVIDSIPDHLEK